MTNPSVELSDISDIRIRSLISNFEQADPTSKKAFVLDLLRMYLDKSMARSEDVFKATEPLTLYAKFRNRGLPNIRTMSFTELLDLGDELSEVISNSEAGKAEEDAFYTSEQAYVAQDNDKFKVIVPFTEAAAVFFGRGTRWCTAAEKNNMFANYYQGEKDPAKRLWIVIFKGKKGKKWQLHISTGQFMDSRDEPITMEDWFAETDFVDWFAKSVMRPCMPKHWEQVYKYYPDLSTLSIPVQKKIIATNIRLFNFFKNPSDEIINEAVQTSSESTVRAYLFATENDDLAQRLQLAALKSFGIGFSVPDDIKPENKPTYDQMVKDWFAKSTPNAAYNTGYNLPYMGFYAVRNGLCGQYADRVREGAEASGK